LKVAGEHEAELKLKGAQESFQKNKQQWKNRLAAVQEETSKEKEKWQLKLDALNAELDKANDQVYQEKARRRAQVQEQINETAYVQMILQNYVDSLEEENEDLWNELTAAIKERRVAERKSEKDRLYAKARHDKLHNEQYLRGQAQDYAAEQEKINKALRETLKKYTDVPQDTKLCLKKEWTDDCCSQTCRNEETADLGGAVDL
jgi:hypothetical protein